jgi:hypothetical protein
VFQYSPQRRDGVLDSAVVVLVVPYEFPFHHGKEWKAKLHGKMILAVGLGNSTTTCYQTHVGVGKLLISVAAFLI